MSGKNQKAETVVTAPTKRTGPKPIKRGSDGKKIMKVARGTARAERRVGLVRDWRNVKGAKPMLPPAGQQTQA